MPKRNECLASYLVARRWFNTATCSFKLQDIHVDVTEKESKLFKRDHPARSGLPYPLDPHSSAAQPTRGPPHAQTPIFPLITTSICDARFTLIGVHFHPRNLILEFSSDSDSESDQGTHWMQVQLLTHTVVQVYTAQEWHERIAHVPKKARGFCIGMGLDFGEYVLAFLTLDLLFKVTYKRHREALDARCHDIYHDFEGTVHEIVKWAESRTHSDRSGLAIHAIRKASHVFLGVGVYTVVEIFHLAGLLPIYTEEEVFDNPSRTGRFIEAYFSFAYYAEENMMDFLLPFLGSNYFLSVRNEDRLAYMIWLKVYAKDRVWVSLQWILQYWELLDWLAAANGRDGGLVRSQVLGFFDVFEPTYIQAGLRKAKNFGPLIFGSDIWRLLGGSTEWEDDPLTTYFRCRGLLKCPTFIHPSLSSISLPLFLPPKAMMDSWTLSHFYYTKDKPFWCAFPNLPSNSLPSTIQSTLEDSQNSMASKSDRSSHLFETIVKFSKEYAIGPTDYCGIARVHHNQTILCHHDPLLTSYFLESFKANFSRRRHLKAGKQKTADPAVAKKHKLATSKCVNATAGNKDDVADKENRDEPKVKHRRLSADKQVVKQVLYHC
ncbi:hypothetical protein ONZ45_g16274 [Pleurotus djamor]|nr:hypothetical protein ONZ45_g16274 [Pleurotus djamor]